MKYSQNLFIGLWILGIIIYSTTSIASKNTPSQIVTTFHEVLLISMKNAKKLGLKGRYREIAPQIKKIFHLPLMAQVSTGSYWRSATKEQAKNLIDAFTHISISTYASQFSGFSGESFVTKSERAGPQNTILVKTIIIVSESKSIDITYVTQNISGQWRIIDILLYNGISELAVRRSEYRRILKTGGFDHLITALNNKANQLLNP